MKMASSRLRQEFYHKSLAPHAEPLPGTSCGLMSKPSVRNTTTVPDSASPATWDDELPSVLVLKVFLENMEMS